MLPEEFRKIAPTIPHLPGVYRYFNHDNEVIYVGKAKDLRKRVSSYFNKTFTGYKTHELVQRIARIEFTVVETEQDAFFLENAQIKAFQPKYNIDLKDDKTYPYIVIKKEPFPRVFLTRKKIMDGSEYLGPFTSVARVRELLNFTRQHVQLRTCRLPLTQKNIATGKFKVCLEYHLGNCKGPCVGWQTEQDYAAGLQRLKHVLKGNLNEVHQHYRQQMQQYADNLEFEKAQRVKKKLDHLEQYRSKSVVVSQKIGDVDVFALQMEANQAVVSYLMVRNGTLIQSHALELTPKLDETEAEMLGFAIGHIRQGLASEAPEVIVPIDPGYVGEGLQISIPRGGEKLKLLELCQKNARIYSQEKMQQRMLNVGNGTKEDLLNVLEDLQYLLHLPELPLHIECFDNSNFQGSYPVSAMVCFKEGLPSKQDYRKFNVKSVTGINDFATMKEAVYRRYKRLATEGLDMPQLVVIDGGKGQLNAALEALESLGLSGQMTVIGLAKNVEEIFFPGVQESLKLSWNSPALRLLRRIRDEVHRFGIGFHRQKRSKGTFRSDLEGIPGVGKTTSTKLLNHFRSAVKVKAASFEQLAEVIGEARARLVMSHFSQNEKAAGGEPTAA
jgi:excinuclease ABC subunit C